MASSRTLCLVLCLCLGLSPLAGGSIIADEDDTEPRGHPDGHPAI